MGRGVRADLPVPINAREQIVLDAIAHRVEPRPAVNGQVVGIDTADERFRVVTRHEEQIVAVMAERLARLAVDHDHVVLAVGGGDEHVIGQRAEGVVVGGLPEGAQIDRLRGVERVAQRIREDVALAVRVAAQHGAACVHDLEGDIEALLRVLHGEREAHSLPGRHVHGEHIDVVKGQHGAGLDRRVQRDLCGLGQHVSMIVANSLQGECLRADLAQPSGGNAQRVFARLLQRDDAVAKGRDDLAGRIGENELDVVVGWTGNLQRAGFRQGEGEAVGVSDEIQRHRLLRAVRRDRHDTVVRPVVVQRRRRHHIVRRELQCVEYRRAGGDGIERAGCFRGEVEIDRRPEIVSADLGIDLVTVRIDESEVDIGVVGITVIGRDVRRKAQRFARHGRKGEGVRVSVGVQNGHCRRAVGCDHAGRVRTRCVVVGHRFRADRPASLAADHPHIVGAGFGEIDCLVVGRITVVERSAKGVGDFHGLGEAHDLACLDRDGEIVAVAAVVVSAQKGRPVHDQLGCGLVAEVGHVVVAVAQGDRVGEVELPARQLDIVGARLAGGKQLRFIGEIGRKAVRNAHSVFVVEPHIARADEHAVELKHEALPGLGLEGEPVAVIVQIAIGRHGRAIDGKPSGGGDVVGVVVIRALGHEVVGLAVGNGHEITARIGRLELQGLVAAGIVGIDPARKQQGAGGVVEADCGVERVETTGKPLQLDRDHLTGRHVHLVPVGIRIRGRAGIGRVEVQRRGRGRVAGHVRAAFHGEVGTRGLERGQAREAGAYVERRQAACLGRAACLGHAKRSRQHTGKRAVHAEWIIHRPQAPSARPRSNTPG